jgi:DNA ligase-1
LRLRGDPDNTRRLDGLFLAGGKPRMISTKLLRQFALEATDASGSSTECYQRRRPRRTRFAAADPCEDAPLDVWMNERLLPARA